MKLTCRWRNWPCNDTDKLSKGREIDVPAGRKVNMMEECVNVSRLSIFSQ